jgi:uridine phosphorylase
MEQMIACGTKVFIGLGWAGSLNSCAPIGSLLLPTTCIREEGTSYHYLANDVIVHSKPLLIDILEKTAQTKSYVINKGPHWSTDAIFREGAEKIKAYRDMGILGVDMESSAMFALGQVFDVSVGNLLVVSDSLWGEWNMSFHTDEIREATRHGEEVILGAMEMVIRAYKAGIFDS